MNTNRLETIFSDLKASGQKTVLPFLTAGYPSLPATGAMLNALEARGTRICELTAASLMLNHGIPVLIVSRRLVHARPGFTLDFYGHLIPSMQNEVAQLMDDLVTPIEVEQVAPGCTRLHQD